MKITDNYGKSGTSHFCDEGQGVFPSIQLPVVLLLCLLVRHLLGEVGAHCWLLWWLGPLLVIVVKPVGEGVLGILRFRGKSKQSK